MKKHVCEARRVKTKFFVLGEVSFNTRIMNELICVFRAGGSFIL